MATENAPPLGFLLRQYRLARELTQEELAERASVSPRVISDIERGGPHVPRRDTVALLAQALALTVEERATFVAAAHPPQAARSPGRLPATVAAASNSLVGRTDEVGLIERHLQGQESAVLLLLAGEPGMGKSRLLQEAVRRGAEAGFCVLQGGCQQRGGQEPYAPLLGALARHLRRMDDTATRTALQGCAWLVKLLPELAAGPIEPLPAWGLAPEQERRLMFDAVGRFLRNVAGPAGTLLVLDDLQWAGTDALDLLRMVAHTARESQVRVLGAYRDSDVPLDGALSILLGDLAHAGLVAQHTLTPLAPLAAEQLINALLPEQMGGRQRERVLQRAGGVPFFLVSCVQGLSQGSREQSGAEDAVPWTVAQSIRQRLAVLDEGTQAILGLAALAGHEVSRALLFAVAERPRHAVLSALEAACHARLLAEVGPAAYRFTHDLIREAVDADLSAARRLLLHQAIAVALEAMPGTPSAEALAYHWARTDDHPRAAQWLEQAGDAAAAGFAHAAAVEHYTAARTHLVTGAADTEALARLDEKVGDRHVLLGAYAQAQQDFVQARAGALTPTRQAELWHKEGTTWDKRGEYDHALSALDAAEAAIRGTDRDAALSDVSAAIELSRGEVYFHRREYKAAEAAMERALSVLSALPTGESTLRAQARAAHLQGSLGIYRWMWMGPDGHASELQQAEAHVRRALALHERVGDQQGIAVAWYNLGELANARDQPAQADACFRRGLSLSEAIGDPEHAAAAWNKLGDLAVQRGEPEAAEEPHRHALGIFTRLGHQEGIAHSWGYLGTAALEQGAFTQAEECYQRQLAIATRIGDRVAVAYAWDNLGESAVRRGDLRTAEACYRGYLGICQRAGDQLGVGHMWLSLSRVAREQGNLSSAVARARHARVVARTQSFGDLEMWATLVQIHAHLAGLPSRAHLRAAVALIEKGRALANSPDTDSYPALPLAIFAAAIHLHQGALATCRAAGYEALRLAQERHERLTEAWAYRLLGQCALAAGAIAEAQDHLRAALALQERMGAALEAARTRLMLAQMLVTVARTRTLSDEARTLLTEAQAQFTTSGAALDMARAERLAASWGSG